MTAVKLISLTKEYQNGENYIEQLMMYHFP